jgi:peptidoglycan-associated lipoprotein
MRVKMIGLAAVLCVLAACSATTPPPPPPIAPGPPGGVGSSAIVPGSQQDLAATAGDRVFFAFDRSDIDAEGRETLRKQADWLNRYPNVDVRIEGHCDERGTREYNLALGARRANAVKNVLIAEGVSPARISTISYGKDRPIVLGSNEEAWAQNRVAITTVQ